FCATAKDIKAWAGVPAKTERFHGGFQRALTARYSRITKFFDEGQASPTSIVVAFRSAKLNAQDLGYPNGWPANSDLSEKPDFVALWFDCEPFDEDTNLDLLIANVKSLLKTRLEAANKDTQHGQSNADEEEAARIEEEEEEEEATEVESLDIE